ncbi:MAG TPA: endonuclease III [Bacteroidetes bacterium]|nr:endonuclease III [Bacteroidota bacterium]
MPSKSPKRARTESLEEKKSRAERILRQMKKEFPQPKTALLHENPFQLLIATILSAQCTDARVNMVTKDLFKKYKTPRDFANAIVTELESDIRSTGFFRMKTKNIMGCSKALVEQHGGKVPDSMETLVQLPGVGRKTANVVLGQAFGIVSGIVVDTHVHRLAQRMGFTSEDTAEKIEVDLMKVFSKKHWIDVGSVFILHGRKTCGARKPRCLECAVNELCPSAILT